MSRIFGAFLQWLGVAALVLGLTPNARAVDNACLKRLAQGQNHFGEPLPIEGLRRLAEGMQSFHQALDQPRLALFVDYTRNSRFKRAFVIDFAACDVLSADYVIHGGSVYTPEEHHWGEPAQDGQLRKCINPAGNRTDMTRPGLYLTWGCHRTQQDGWTDVAHGCQGVKLVGLEAQNRDAWARGVVLHEHESIPDDATVKPAGQGCPAFPPGRLKRLMRYGLFHGAMVFLYAPQCEPTNGAHDLAVGLKMPASWKPRVTEVPDAASTLLPPAGDTPRVTRSYAPASLAR